jgi:hypothetical protein
VPRWVIRVVRLVAILLALVALFVVALTFVYTLSNARVMKHARSSVATLEAEGLYPQPFGWRGPRLDNFTDALMMDVSVADKHRSALVNAMSMSRQVGLGTLRTINGLRDSSRGHVSGRYENARYWHGYQVILRPMLYLFDYAEIRYLNMLALSALACVACLSVNRALGFGGVGAFVGSLVLTGFYVVPLSLQFSSVTYLMLLGVIGALELEIRGKLDGVFWEFFAVLGALTSFLDLLTAPLLTLGMPIAAVLLTRSRRGRITVLDALKALVVASLLWGFGFAFSWAAKWLIASPVLGVDVIADGLESAGARAGAAGLGASIAGAISYNAQFLFTLLSSVQGRTVFVDRAILLAAALVILVAAALVAMWLRSGRTGVDSRVAMRRRAPVLLVAALPFCWFLVLSQHSQVHAWFVYRILAISIFVVMAVVFAGFDNAAEQVDPPA